MARTPAERQRACYRRRRSGRGKLLIEVDLIDLAACLIDEGLIRPDQEEDKAAIAAALEQVIRGLIILTRDGVRLRDWLE
jgi:hypothetical protein